MIPLFDYVSKSCDDGDMTNTHDVNGKGQEAMWIAERNEAAKTHHTPSVTTIPAETITVARKGRLARLLGR